MSNKLSQLDNCYYFITVSTIIIIIIIIIITVTIFLDLLGLNINWDIVVFSSPVADVTFLFFSFFLFLIYIVQATNLIKLKLKLTVWDENKNSFKEFGWKQKKRENIIQH